MNAAEVTVGIVSAEEISFTLNAPYSAKGQTAEGQQTVRFNEGGIEWNGNTYQRLTFTPETTNASFTLHEVTIGKQFHWERKERQTFTGTLRFIIDEGKVCAINILPVEDYLVSVISSEMSPMASPEFLKAHAVISRSWLMAQIEKRQSEQEQSHDAFFSFHKSDAELIRWYDREDHTLFDVCADDHCQRYQGITKAWNPIVAEAVKATEGQVLTMNGTICDARFSKCCGGMSETYETCWEDTPKPYLQPVRDADSDADKTDLTDETEAERWIRTTPPAFCNASRAKNILAIILNNYDQETSDFYRWTVSYTKDELTELVNTNLKDDFGEVLDLIPIARGHSGRICKLKIVGTKKSFIIGKELEIRRVLSRNHLFSSAFTVEKTPTGFILHGAGWGHGVGLCQIGAAVMGEQGYNYRQILLHYYRGAEINE